LFDWLPQNPIFAIFIWSILESAILPIPAEVIIIPYAAVSNINSILIATVGSVGSLIGAFIDYYIGLKGIDKLSKILGKDLRSMATGFIQKYKRFGKYGFMITLAFGRLFPLSLKPLMFYAGAIRFKLLDYSIVILICSFVRYFIAATIGESIASLLISLGL